MNSKYLMNSLIPFFLNINAWRFMTSTCYTSKGPKSCQQLAGVQQVELFITKFYNSELNNFKSFLIPVISRIAIPEHWVKPFGERVAAFDNFSVFAVWTSKNLEKFFAVIKIWAPDSLEINIREIGRNLDERFKIWEKIGFISAISLLNGLLILESSYFRVI